MNDSKTVERNLHTEGFFFLALTIKTYNYYLELATNMVIHSKNCWVVLTQLWIKYG